VKTWAAALLLLAACRPQCYPESRTFNWTSFEVPADFVRGYKGIMIAGNLDASRVNKVVRTVEQCLQGVEAKMSQEEKGEARCDGFSPWPLEVRSCLIVAEAPGWHVSSCTGEQLFSCEVGQSPCAAKGFEPNPQCPCSCRGTFQDRQTAFVTPNLRLLPATLVTAMTGCQSPWTEHLGPCSSARISEEQ